MRSFPMKIVIAVFGLSALEFTRYYMYWTLCDMVGNVSNCVRSWHIVCP